MFNYFVLFYTSEGLIYTASINTVERILRQFASTKNVPYIINRDDEHGKIQADVINFPEKIINLFLDEVNNLGYFTSEIVAVNKENPNYAESEKFSKENFLKFFNNKGQFKHIFLNFEAKFDVEISKYPEYLYHVCRKKNLEKILRIGLAPRTKSKLSNHPDRIYFTDSLEGAQTIKNRFEKLFPDEYKILKIEPKRVHQLRLFKDPNSKELGGLYTLHNISPTAIELI